MKAMPGNDFLAPSKNKRDFGISALYCREISSKGMKSKIYRNDVHPVALYDSEGWTIIKKTINGV